MKNPKRVETFAERQKVKGETAEIGAHYVCGCGNFLWILIKASGNRTLERLDSLCEHFAVTLGERESLDIVKTEARKEAHGRR